MSIIHEHPHLKEKLFSILKRKNSPPSDAAFKRQIPFDPQVFPIDPASRYPGYEGYWLEIGSGWGEFTRESALQNPHAFTVALEKKKKRVRRSIKKQEAMGIENIGWMVIDIHWVFENIFSPSSFDRVTMNFPDPWPKKKHTKNRFFSDSFLLELTSIMKPGALLQFATDYWPYLEAAASTLESQPSWKNCHGAGVILEKIAGRPESYFERLKKDEGENTYFVEFQRAP